MVVKLGDRNNNTMIKVFGYPSSSCTRMVINTLYEKEAPYIFKQIDLSKGEQQQAHYLEKQPFGLVPVLDDNGFLLYESRAIIRYLDQKLKGIALTPKDIHAFARMEQWISIEQSYFSPPVVALIQQLYWWPILGKNQDRIVIEQAKNKVMHVLDVAERSLATQPYLSGEQFSLAEICWMPYLAYLFQAKVGELVAERPSVNQWWQTIQQRPAWLKTMQLQ